jgi:hypothetical protein
LVLNRLHNVADIELHSLRLDHKLFHLVLQETLSVTGPRLWDLCDNGPNPRTYFEPALLNQMLYNFMCCVGVDFEFDCECSNRRKCLARLKLTTDERPFDGKQELIKDGLARLQIEPE